MKKVLPTYTKSVNFLAMLKNIVDFGPPVDCSGRHEDSYGRIGQDETLQAQP
jgi:hypothetical protein